LAAVMSVEIFCEKSAYVYGPHSEELI